MSIITNPIIISVVLMCALCLLKFNVMFSIIVSGLVAGLLSGMDLGSTMGVFISGMGGGAETALSYILLGILAAAMSNSGLANILSGKISKLVKGKKVALVLIIAFVAVLSQNLVPIHIAFIPILIPALLPLMNEMKLDRRAVACALSFGLVAPYACWPLGFGLIFHGIVSDNMTANGMAVAKSDVWKSNWILFIAMVVGLIVSLIYFSKDREYKTDDSHKISENKAEKMTMQQIFALIAAVVALIVQLLTDSMALGAMAGILIMLATKVIPWKLQDIVADEGVQLMGFIAFVMLVAAGYGEVISQTGAVDSLVKTAIGIVGDSKIGAAVIMMLVGLIIDMGIGTSFGTVPIIAVIFVPFAQQVGLSIPATTCLISAAAVLGDAGSPASDTMLGPTAGLNADGQHDHIWDSCVPGFIFYNIPLFIGGLIGAMIL